MSVESCACVYESLCFFMCVYVCACVFGAFAGGKGEALPGAPPGPSFDAHVCGRLMSSNQYRFRLVIGVHQTLANGNACPAPQSLADPTPVLTRCNLQRVTYLPWKFLEEKVLRTLKGKGPPLDLTKSLAILQVGGADLAQVHLISCQYILIQCLDCLGLSNKAEWAHWWCPPDLLMIARQSAQLLTRRRRWCWSLRVGRQWWPP